MFSKSTKKSRARSHAISNPPARSSRSFPSAASQHALVKMTSNDHLPGTFLGTKTSFETPLRKEQRGKSVIRHLMFCLSFLPGHLLQYIHIDETKLIFIATRRGHSRRPVRAKTKILQNVLRGKTWRPKFSLPSKSWSCIARPRRQLSLAPAQVRVRALFSLPAREFLPRRSWRKSIWRRRHTAYPAPRPRPSRQRNIYICRTTIYTSIQN